MPPLRIAGACYVEAFRNTPLPVLMLLFFFGFTKVGIGPYSSYRSAIVVLSVYTAAFLAETIRSGINTVSGGQGEAARALGLTFPQVLVLVVLPQAIRTVVAPIGSIFIALLKNTSIASVVSAVELTKIADDLNTNTARPIPVFLGAGIAYLVLSLGAGQLFGVLERRVAVRR